MPSMPSKEYWEQRSERLLVAGENKAEAYIAILESSYNEVIMNIKKELESFYAKYAKDNKISLSEARKRLKPNELTTFSQQAKVYLDEIKRLGNDAFTANYKNYLRNLSGKAYVTRLQELMMNIRHEIEILSVNKQNALKDVLSNVYVDIYEKTMFDIQNNASVGIMFTLPNVKAVELVVKEKWLGENYSDRIWKDKNTLVSQIEQLISQDFVRGRNSNLVAKDLAVRLNVSLSNAKRLVRTETNYVANKAMIQSYKDSELVEKYQYLATLDNRTSAICIELDAKIFHVKEATVGVNYPPMHPNCRSTTIPYFEDDEISKSIVDRIARNNGGDGKSERLGRDTKLSYKEWKQMNKV